MKPETDTRFEDKPARSAIEIGCFVIFVSIIVAGIFFLVLTMKEHHREKTQRLIEDVKRRHDDLMESGVEKGHE